MPPVCPHCHGRRHLLTPDGWRRCACAAHASVLPSLRCGEARYPDAYDTQPPFPREDLTFIGDYRDFRYRAWRSVLTYPSLLYEYLDAYRLVDINFERDIRYQSVRELVLVDLLIVTLGVAELPHSYVGPVLCQVITLRQHAGVPTWVYSSLSLPQIRQTYGPALETLLAPTVRTLAVVAGVSDRINPTSF